MAAVVEAALERQARQAVGLVPIEAGTGIGKTLAYLVPGALHAARTGARVLVSTYTIELGRQVVEEDGPVARAVARACTGRDLRIAHMRGRRNFGSASRARAVGTLLRADGMPAEAWKPYLAVADRLEQLAAQACAMARIGDASADAETVVRRALLDQLERDLGTVLSRDDVCLLPTSPESEQAVHALGLQLAEKASILVTTHAYTAVSLALRALFGADESPFGLLVVDEADQWASAAASVSLVSLSLQALERAIESVSTAGRHGRDAGGINHLADVALGTLGRLREIAPREPDATRPLAANDPTLALLRSIGNQVDALIAASDADRQHTAGAAGALDAQSRDIERIGKLVAGNESGFWQPRWTTSRIQGLPSLNVGAKAPGRLLKRLWAVPAGRSPLARTIVLTSATLSTPGFGEASRWSAIESATGIEPASEMLMGDLAAVLQPRRFGAMKVRFADPRAPVPRLDVNGALPADALAYTTEVIGAAMAEAAAGGDRTLVLVPSYADVEQLAPRLPGALAHRRGTPLADMLRTYRETPGCVLITPGAWAGVNLPGQVQHLVIPRIPYTPREAGEAAHMVQLLSTTLNKLAQGIGRGVRTDSDAVTLWFGDPRMPIPDCVTEQTGLVRSEHANPALLAAIPARFREAFGTAPDLASIGVIFTPSRPVSWKPPGRKRDTNVKRTARPRKRA